MRLFLRILSPALVIWSVAQHARGDVIVIANRTGREMPIRFVPVKGQARQVTLALGENLPLYSDGKANVSFSASGGGRNYLLDANSAYFLGRGPGGQIDLQKIGLGEDGTLLQGHSLPGTASQAPLATVTVKILVDEDEPGRQTIWEHRLRTRVEAASAIFEKYFRTRLQVVAVGTWTSDNSTNDFMASLAEFEREVSPAPAQLAIGFTSQWKVERGRIHMAGTRGPLHTHIFAREGNPNLSEAERLEYLIHELGHFFGAAHSPERDSVMRPVLGDKQAGRSNSQIHFDPVNTLAMAIISEEMRRKNLSKLGQLSADTRKRLSQIYMELARAVPNDPAGFVYAQLMKSEAGSPMVVATREVLQQIVRSAADNRGLPDKNIAGITLPTRKHGDELTNYLVREAARAAQSQPEEVRLQAFITGVSLGLNDSEVRTQLPAMSNVLRTIEPPSERIMRMTALGDPTMLGRRDLLRRFLASAFATVNSDGPATVAAALSRELADARGPGGFSFANIAADRAGVRFAQGVLDRRLSLPMLAATFNVTSYMPAVDGLPEKLSADELAAQFGNEGDPRFQKKLADIEQRISRLPAYRPITPALGL
jgi:hypothetical protein